MNPDYLFRAVGESFEPSPLVTGPWRADAMHGGPPAALVCRAIEAELAQGESLTRLSVELERPVPVEPLTVSVESQSISRRVSHLVAVLWADDKRVASARGLVLRGDPLPPPDAPSTRRPLEVAGPEHHRPAPVWTSGEVTAYHRDAVEHRFLAGGFGEVGPAVSWARLLVPLVEGEATSGWATVAALADFGSGISSIYGPESGIGLINADLTIALSRTPVGPWIRLDSATEADLAGGRGLGITHLADTNGELGVATQSLLGINPGT